MNSEINNNVALSPVIPVKANAAAQNTTASSSSSNDIPVVTQLTTNNQSNANNKTPSLASIKSATSQSNPLLQAVNLSVEYNVDSSTKEVVMKVVDTQTGKTVRQIPSAEMLDFVKRLQDWEAQQKGAVIQTSA